MPTIVRNETWDQHGNLIHSEQVAIPSIIAGQHRETHQIAIGGGGASDWTRAEFSDDRPTRGRHTDRRYRPADG